MFGRLGPLEIVLIVVVILIIFGAGKLPQVFGAMGKGIRSFRKGTQGELDEDDYEYDDEDEDEEEEEERPRRRKKTSTKKKKVKRSS